MLAEGKLPNRFFTNQTLVTKLIEHILKAGLAKLVRTRTKMEKLRHML